MADIIPITIKQDQKSEESIKKLIDIGWVESNDVEKYYILTREGTLAALKVLELYYEGGIKEDEPYRNLDKGEGMSFLIDEILMEFDHFIVYLTFMQPQLESLGIRSLRDLDYVIEFLIKNPE